MLDKELIGKIRELKENKKYTLYDLSRVTDMQVATLARWLKTNRINKLYAKMVKEKLHIS
jgi:transcriptional regulator with XRE-family HTH domain